MVALTEPATVLDLAELSVRDANAVLRRLPAGSRARVLSPRGRHNLAVGLHSAVTVDIEGPAGYYAGGLCEAADVTVHGPAGWGAGENLMSGSVVVKGDASQSAAATARGGLVAVEGSASLRAGISLKGATLAVAGDVGAYCGFLAQAGTILVGGDSGHGLGDSLYEAVIYVAGRVTDLGTDAQVEDIGESDVAAVRAIVERCGFHHIDPQNVTRVASAKQLYHFDTHKAGSY